LQPSINRAFEAGPPSSPVQADAGERKFLAVSLLYTEVRGAEREKPGLLSVREAARRLGISTTAAYSLCRTGRLPYTRVLNAIRIVEADVEELIAQHCLS
jgi:excisionase family DNA binding protein